jgi:1,4-dihydroxy-2-naphthoate octaprenyltransferase
LETKTTELYTPSQGEVYYYKNHGIQLIRPLTLTGSISPILVGTGMAMVQGHIRLDLFFALLLSAIFIQSATNVLNDYFDFKSGQDKEKWVCEGEAKHHGPAHQNLPLIASMLFATAIGIGLWLALNSSLWVIAVGVLGIVAGYKYSAGSDSFSSVGLGEAVAAIFLGPVVTLLAYFVQTNTITLSVILISLLFSMLIASMILTNNIRDFKKDSGFRTTLAHKLGKKNAIRLLTTLIILSYFSMFLFIYVEILPVAAILTVFAFPVAVHLLWSFRKTASLYDEKDGMKWAARHHWAFGILLAIGIFI